MPIIPWGVPSYCISVGPTPRQDRGFAVVGPGSGAAPRSRIRARAGPDRRPAARDRRRTTPTAALGDAGPSASRATESEMRAAAACARKVPIPLTLHNHVPYYSLYTPRATEHRAPHPAPAPDGALRALAPWRATRRDGGERAPHASKRGKTTVIWRPRSAHPATALNARRACALAHGPAVQPAWRPLPAVTLLRRRCDVQLGNNVRPAAGARNARCTLAVSATAASAARAGSGGGRVGTVRSA